MNFQEKNFFNNNKISDEDDSIQISNIVSFLFRNKFLVSSLALLGILSGTLSYIFEEKTYEGEFQIVLEEENPMAGSQINSDLKKAQKLFGGKGAGQYLDTEVGILESPSVLMSIFEFVKQKKLDKNQSAKGLKFKNWKEDSLNINLIDKTSILNLSYRDTDKDLIIPVLEKISFGYQEYSGKKRNRQLQLGKIFFDEQIKLYKQKTLQSLKNVETFALENELAIIPMEQVTENNISSQNEYIPETNSMLVNIEKIRTQNLSILKDSKNQLNEINQIGDDPEKIIYIGSLIPELVATGLPEKLKEIDYKIELNKLRYKDSDIAITKLIEERIILTRLLKKQAISFLEAKINKAEMNIEDTKRPDGVIVKYKQLISQAERDARTLGELEINNIALLLEKSRKEDPWQLITSPTLSSEPVSPSLSNRLLLGLLIGFSLGNLISYIKENKKQVIYNISEIKNLEVENLEYQLSIGRKNDIKKTVSSLLDSIYIEEKDNLAIIDCGKKALQIDKILNDIIKANNLTNRLSYIDDSSISKSFTKSILLIKLGITSKNDILEIRKQLNLIGVKNLGFIAIEGLDINQKDDLEEIILYTKNKYLLLIKSLKLISSEYNWEFFRNKFKKYFRLLLNDNKPNSGK